MRARSPLVRRNPDVQYAFRKRTTKPFMHFLLHYKNGKTRPQTLTLIWTLLTVDQGNCWRASGRGVRNASDATRRRATRCARWRRAPTCATSTSRSPARCGTSSSRREVRLLYSFHNCFCQQGAIFFITHAYQST
ncbi:unnamed protein product [Parnassius mnemosyne]|uniref:Ribosomal protein/NADH dehydrogenase domain-containing protein n=1 Tax=Parnassius mnemosyne TaxID=213953 RepID=A0AAV1KTQ7_9NEOP